LMCSSRAVGSQPQMPAAQMKGANEKKVSYHQRYFCSTFF